MKVNNPIRIWKQQQLIKDALVFHNTKRKYIPFSIEEVRKSFHEYYKNK